MGFDRSSAQQARQRTRQAASESKPWVERLGRFGYAANGVVYLLLGLLAAQAAIGVGGATTDTPGVLERVVEAPFGQVLLALIAVGLVGYALWNLIQAALNTDNEGANAQGITTRLGYALTAVAYTGLALYALRLLRGSGGGSSGDAQAQDWTARLMSQPFGPWLVGLVGLGVVGFGLYQLYQVYSERFLEQLRHQELPASKRRWVERLGRFGFAARGVVFGIIGLFLVMAGVQTDPSSARGLAGALDTLAAQPFGPWLLGLVALGLMAYGLFMLVLARYRRMGLR